MHWKGNVCKKKNKKKRKLVACVSMTKNYVWAYCFTILDVVTSPLYSTFKR